MPGQNSKIHIPKPVDGKSLRNSELPLMMITTKWLEVTGIGMMLLLKLSMISQ